MNFFGKTDHHKPSFEGLLEANRINPLESIGRGAFGEVYSADFT